MAEGHRAVSVLYQALLTGLVLTLVTRRSEDDYDREDLADVRFVPLIGKEGWESEGSEWQTRSPRVVQSRPAVSVSLPGLIAKHADLHFR